MDSYTSVPQAKILFSSRGDQYFLCLNRLMRPKLSGNLCYLRTIFEGTYKTWLNLPCSTILTFSVSAGTVLVKRRSPLLPLGWSRTFLSHMIICSCGTVPTMNRVLFPLPSFFGSVMPLPVVCRRLLRVLRSVYIWQYDTSTVAELLTVVSHSHLIFSEKLALDVSPFCH